MTNPGTAGTPQGISESEGGFDFSSIETKDFADEIVGQEPVVTESESQADDEKETDQTDVNSTQAASLATKSSRARINVTVGECIGALIAGDRNQIIQAMLNICNNAIDAMPEGGALHLNCVHQPGGPDRNGKKFFAIEVSDTGRGMTPDIIEKMFDPFFTTKARERGTGLGMAITERIIKAHGGEVHVESRPGIGTTVRVFLPEAEPDTVARAAAPRPSPAGGAETILIVDDEYLIVQLCEKMLTRAGYNIMKASGGAQALELFGEHGEKIDLVVLDMLMPDMSGEEVFKEMRKLRPDASIMLASGYSEDGAAASLLASGALGFLQKPYTPVELREKVRKFLDGAKQT